MGVRKDKRRQGVITSLNFHGEYENSPTDLLAVAIVIQAIEEWRSLIKQKAWHDAQPQKNCNFTELRNFFKGEWCAFLLVNVEIDPARILGMLEAELQIAMRKERQKK